MDVLTYPGVSGPGKGSNPPQGAPPGNLDVRRDPGPTRAAPARGPLPWQRQLLLGAAQVAEDRGQRQDPVQAEHGRTQRHGAPRLGLPPGRGVPAGSGAGVESGRRGPRAASPAPPPARG